MAFAGIALLSTREAIPALIGVVLIGIAIYGLQKRFAPRKYAFGFEMNSGRVVYAYSKDIDFIGRMMNSVTEYIESGREGKMMINIEKQDFTYTSIADRSVTNTGTIGGDVTSGDKAEVNVDDK